MKLIKNPLRLRCADYAGQIRSAARAAAEALEGRTLFSAGSFGDHGTVLTPFSGSLSDSATSLLVQADGKLVAVGDTSGQGFNANLPSTLSLVRYTSNGKLDPTFGNGGQVTTAFPNGSANAPSTALEADQEILVLSPVSSVNGVTSATLALYTTSGHLDPAFGIGGEIPVLEGTNSLDYVAVLPSGEIVVAGSVSSSSAKTESFVVEEFQSNGALDTSFGTNGRATTFIGASGSLSGIALQGTDIVLAGNTTNATTSKNELVVARYTSAGVLDTTFGTAGLASYPTSGNGYVSGVAIGTGNSIFVAGSSFVSTPKASYNTFLTQLTANGALDAAYGTGGTTTIDGLNGRAVAVQSNGEAVVAGTVGFGVLTKAGAARFTTSGVPDSGFGTGGLVVTALTTSDSISAIALQPTTLGTKVLIAGNGFHPATGTDFLLARYTTAGALDTSFGSDGIQTTDFAGPVSASAQSIVSDGHGGTLVGGVTGSANGSLAVADYLPDGQLNPKFGNGGTVQVTFNSYIYSAFGGYVALQSDGKILLVGTSIQPGATNFDFNVARLLPGGKLDPSFGKGGKVTTFSGAADTDMGATGGVVIQPDGKILVAGYTENYANDPSYVDKGVVIRYNPNGSLDNTFGNGGRETFNLPGVYRERITGLALEPDGKILVGGFVTSATTQQENYFLQKLYANGQPDTAFAPLGQIVTNFSGFFDMSGQLLLRPGGKILVVGATINPTTFATYMTVAQFTASGAPDLAFGTSGQASVGFPGNPNFTGVGFNNLNFALLPDGKVIVVGTYLVQNPTTSATTSEQFALVQLTTAGKLDTSFGSGGTVLTSFGDGLVSAQAVLGLSDGDLEVVGSSTDMDTQLQDFALAEYSSDGVLVP